MLRSQRLRAQPSDDKCDAWTSQRLQVEHVVALGRIQTGRVRIAASSGGRFLARSVAAKAYEDGKVDRTVLIEFDSVDQAVAVHDSAAYQAALALLDGGAVRDLRIVPGT